jgi:ribonuclease E
MAKRMLIDTTHPEETRVVVLNGNRLEEFDVESSTKQQVKGNIYLAKVTRVEPSLQAAFVEYGGNRHGFLAFGEVHPDYYRIPVGDREADSDSNLPDVVESADAGPDGAEEAGALLATALPEPVAIPETAEADAESESGDDAAMPDSDLADPVEAASEAVGFISDATATDLWPSDEPPRLAAMPGAPALYEGDNGGSEPVPEAMPPAEDGGAAAEAEETESEEAAARLLWENTAELGEAEAAVETPAGGEGEPLETIGGDDLDEARRQHARSLRQYKIQEVIKRRQIMLVQVAKEERGTKGAALTTYLSLAGRYCVLMPNTARGGGVSRKITSLADRRRLKDILEELDIPEGMGVIVRTAGAERSKAEIRRDYEYLLRLWNEIRELTLRSTAPALIYEEGDLIKRSIRDLYTRDIDDVLVEGEDGYRAAKAFMKMLMPSHARRVQPYRDPQIGLFHRFQVEGQIDAIHAPSVQLRSGGYIVINQTEALVAIDVNSGRATRERNIEETALRTNLEAAEEIARQLKLRDLAGLIVIDFIDMEEHRNQAAVERRLKEMLKNDRARIQVGRISPFGLLEMSRQRLRPSLAEASTQPCPHCGGTGHIRSTESTALYVLRSIEEEGMRRRSTEVCVYVPTTVALYILNHKRESLAQLEARFGLHVLVARDDALIPPAFRLERLHALASAEASVPAPLTQAPEEDEDEDEEVAEAAETAETAETTSDEAGEDRRRRARRRRRRRRDGEPLGTPGDRTEDAAAADAAPAADTAMPGTEGGGDTTGDLDRQRRRRGRRGGRRRLRHPAGAEPGFADRPPSAEAIEILPTVPAAAVEFEAEEAAAAVESGSADGAGAIETASLPALAGDAPPGEAVESGMAVPGDGGSAPAEPDLPPATERPAAESIEIVAGETEDTASASPPVFNGADEPETKPAAQAVTQKPANPRRGWWQRLIQP